MARRRLTVKRIDPWSVLKFGAVVNLAMLAVGLLVLGVVFFIIDRLQLIDQACELAFDVGFTACGLNVGNLFRALTLLGLLGVIILTAVLVFLSFLHNLIADLTGGLALSVIDDSPAPRATTPAVTGATSPAPSPTVGRSSAGRRVGRPPVAPLGSQGERTASDRSATRDRGTPVDARDRGSWSSGGPPPVPRRDRDDDRTAAMPRASRDDRDEGERTAAMPRAEVDSGELFGGR